MIPRTPRSVFAATAVASLVFVSACSGDDEAGTTTPVVSDPTTTTTDGAATTTTTTTATTATTNTSTGDDGTTTTVSPATTEADVTTTVVGSTTTDPADPTDTDPRTDILEPRVGTWVVGDAGEIEVNLTADGLVLVDVRPEPGWQVTIDEAAPDEIEVDFARGPIEWEIEIEWENGILEIEIDQDIEPAEPGVVPAGIAGSVAFDVGPNGLVLSAVESEPNWDVAVTEESSDEIEVLFVNGLAEYEVEIELDDGQIEIEVDFEVAGPFTP